MIWVRSPSRRWGALVFAAAIVAIGLSAAPAAAVEFSEFGIESVTANETDSRAGRHPDVTTGLVANHIVNEEGRVEATARLQDLVVEMPPGLVGNPNNFPRCNAGQFRSVFGNCPVDSQIGIVRLQIAGNAVGQEATMPLFNLEPSQPDMVARFGFYAAFIPTFINVNVRTADDYGITATVEGASATAALISTTATLWGNPASPEHDAQRLTSFEGLIGCETACMAPGGTRPSGAAHVPFLSNPSACEDQEVRFTATSYQLPGEEFTDRAPLPPITECQGLPFDPTVEVAPQEMRPGAPTGLSVHVEIPQTNSENLPAASALRSAKVVLPEGMAISSGVAEGLEACSEDQVHLGQELDADCPEASQLGIATFASPSLPAPLHGAVYQRTPEAGDLFQVWLVADEFGLHLKLPGRIEADAQSGRLTASFSDLPQLPVEAIDLEFKGGASAPLKNPDTCGTYSTEYELTPWSGGPPATGQSQMNIEQGCNTTGGFNPDLSAGIANPVAGAFSPLVVDVTRPDRDQNLRSFDIDLPPGLLAKLKGVPLCSEENAATGVCPSDRQIGIANVAVGVGPEPLWLPQPGKEATAIYLGGPYKGSPNSVITKVPAQAGPFDLGTVVVRAGITVDPDTARVSVKTDPLPQILEGVPVRYRTIHAAIDRDQFVIAPTNCEALAVNSTITSVQGATAHPNDRFQVGDCAALSFGPRLKLRLKGGIQRRAYPKLIATLTTAPGEANIRKISVALPRTEFLAQEHIDTVCTRVQFAAHSCPPGSIYGYATAITPLLDQPLQGPVYLRSSSHKLPDLVAALDGQFDINLSGRIDSINGGLRTTFTSVPDAPVTKFVLKMKGGKKSLLVNSRDICASSRRAIVKMDGQNGKVHDSYPVLRSNCGKSKK